MHIDTANGSQNDTKSHSSQAVFSACFKARKYKKKQCIYSVSLKNPPCGLRFSDIFWQTVENFKSIFTHLLYVPIYARLQFFIQLSQTLTKLCHIKRDYLVQVICSKCPPSAETHAFRRLRKSLIALLIVIRGKSSQICCFYNVNKHVGYDMTSSVTSFAQ